MNVVARCVFVPLSLPLTAGALRLGVSANAVTAIRAGLLAVSAAVIPFTLWGVALFLFAVILDHVDGGICRARNRKTWFGKFIDGIADMFGDMLLLPALGLYVAWHNGPSWALSVAAYGTTALAMMLLVTYRAPLFRLLAGTFAPRGQLDVADLVFTVRYVALVPLLLVPAILVAFLAALYAIAAALVSAQCIHEAWFTMNKAKP